MLSNEFGDPAILEEDRRYLKMPVARLDTGMAWAADPPSGTRNLIGNLEALLLENDRLLSSPDESLGLRSRG